MELKKEMYKGVEDLTYSAMNHIGYTSIAYHRDWIKENLK
jgi:hypothetical protein